MDNKIGEVNDSYASGYDKIAKQKKHLANMERMRQEDKRRDDELRTAQALRVANQVKNKPVRTLRVKIHHKAKNPPGIKAMKIILFALIALVITYVAAYGNVSHKMMLERGAIDATTYANGPDIIITDKSQVPSFEAVNDRMADELYNFLHGDSDNFRRGG